MANQKISELTALLGSNVADDDALAIVDTSTTETKKLVFSELKSALDTSTGFVRITGDTMTGDLSFGDDDRAIFGAGSDLTIEHNGTNSTITNATGHLYIMNSSDDKDIHIQSDDGSGGLATYFLADGSSGQAKLYHNNAGTSTLRLNTSSDGIDITGHADIEGHFTATDGCTITTADNSTQLTLTSTDADASEGPRLDLKRDSSSPADGDLIGTIRFLGEDSTSASNTFGEIQVEADDVTDGSEDGEMRLMIRNNGNLRNAVEIGSTEVVFNEASDDVDFRVESDNNTHALFVEGSSGNLLVGKTSASSAVHGGEIRSTGQMVAAVDGSWAGLFNRETSDGEILRFKKDDATVGYIGTGNSGDLYIGNDDTGFMFAGGSDAILPTNQTSLRDNAIDLGSSSYRFDDIYATNGTIQTSDRNEKQDIEELTEAEQRVAVAAKGLLRKFKWKSAVAEKGEAARTHFGIIAQDLQAAFAAEGLDSGDYAMFISSTWWEHQVEVPAVEADEENGIEASDAYTHTDTYDTAEEAPEGATQKTRLGVRYSELLAFIIAAI